MNEHLQAAREWIEQSERVVVLTGAGISTDSGIPDFRGPQGVWTKNPKAEKLSDIRYYMSDPEVRRLAWQGRLSHPGWNAKPNAGHLALATLERSGRLHALVTQNIDGLHQLAGNSAEKVIEVHGTMHDAVCMNCSISFGQALVPEVIARAMRSAQEADLLLAVGTSLSVYPVAHAVPAARAVRARIVIVNGEPTQFDGIADAVLRGPIGEILPQLTPDRRRA